MGKRLTKIYTRTGDDGTTGLADGSRIAKDAPRIAAIGDVDELNSAMGLLLATGWVLAEPYLRDPSHRWGALALIVVSIVVMLRTRLSPMWLVALGTVVGALGFV